MTFIATIQSPKQPSSQKCRLNAPSAGAAVSMLERQGYQVLSIAPEAPATGDASAFSGAASTPTASLAAFNASQAKAKIQEASKDAMDSIRMLWIDPFHNMASAAHSLGKPRALGAGVALGVAFAVCALCFAYALAPEGVRHAAPLSIYFKVFICALIPFVSLTGASGLLRMICKKPGAWEFDAFISGVALLPLGMVALAVGLLGLGNFEVIAILAVFAVPIVVLLLFSGYVKVSGITERAAFVAVPAAILLAAWFSKIILLMWMKHLG